MSNENVEIVRRAADAWNDGELETALGVVDPEIEVEVALGTPVDGTYHGHEGLVGFLSEFWSQFDAYRSEVIECIPAGDEVFLAVRHLGTGKGSGATVEMPGWQVCSVRNGRIVRWGNFKTRDEALEAAGLSEENLQLGREVMEALSAQDLPRMISLADPEVEWHSFFAEVGEGGVYVGHEGTRRYVRDLDDAWEVVRADIDRELGAGDVVLFIGRIHYRGKESGAENEDPAGWMLKFRDGRLVHFRAFRDPERALEAAGLSE